MSFHTHYRPKNFDEIVGNHEQISALRKLFEKSNHPHTFLFSGPPGCGKTTAARVCASVLGQGSVQVQEINSANNRGIDTARQITEMTRYASDGPMIFIIDEVHKATGDWQNAMLKTLEEPPEHVYFFLCTTDPQKLLPAVISRCQEFKFAAMTNGQLAQTLNRVIGAENLTIEREVLVEIIDNCGGSARKALVLLEKVAALESVEDRLKVAKLGAASEEEAETKEFCQLLLKQDWSRIAAALRTMNTEDPERIRRAVLGYMGAVVLGGGKSAATAARIMEFFAAPVYDTGKQGLILAAFQSVYAE